MRYWYDCEFIENGSTIEMLSIGIISEDGRELYLQTTRAAHYRQHPQRCPNEWVRANVVPFLTDLEMTRTEMQQALLAFCDLDRYGKPEFWGYYSAYDHVALCQLFGTMMELPKGWPMYTRDIKQLCDSVGNPPLPPQGKDEHHALADARWNRQAYEFLMNVLEG
jgi:3' exoribonuclease, RNase T-like